MTDTGLIREDKEGKANPTEQREETVVSRKKPNRAKGVKKPISIITEKQSVPINT